MNKQELTKEVIKDLKEKYGDVYKSVIDELVIVWRPLTRDEYKEIVAAEVDIIEKEEIISKKCVVWPELTEEDWKKMPAGIPTLLSDNIMAKSGFEQTSVEKL